MITMEDIISTEEELSKPVKTTHKESWKAFERAVSKDFGTHRTPLSGMVKTITNSDTLHKKIYVECKYRANDYHFWDEFMALRQANAGRIVAWKVAYKGEKVWLFYFKDFFTLMNATRKKIFLHDSGGKYRSILTLYRQTEQRAEIENKTPLIALKRKGCTGYLVGTHPDFLDILRSDLKR